MSMRETGTTMFDMLMYRLGFVRRKHYEDLCGRYERLYRRFVGKRMENDRLLDRLREAGAA